MLYLEADAVEDTVGEAQAVELREQALLRMQGRAGRGAPASSQAGCRASQAGCGGPVLTKERVSGRVWGRVLTSVD